MNSKHFDSVRMRSKGYGLCCRYDRQTAIQETR